eukprot:TRINITY_DN31286_c0_g1_i1.p1 TRINITY_DN31286_c0_g1~~TRINITY_DN31286_c0_g1_i1.p1  ORF type:complete len:252 (-),score=41.57 TRINITY_DN31286_c0_g1_i1:540-1295(-)
MSGMGTNSSFRFGRPIVSLALTILLATTALPFSAHALTEPKKEPEQIEQEEPAAKTPVEDDQDQTGGSQTLPMPDSLTNKPENNAVVDDPTDTPDVPVEFINNLDTLPEPVKKMRMALVEAAASGDIERLRPLLGTGADETQVSVGDAPEDPIAALKSLSGDPDGREVLAILLDIISTGVAHTDKGTPQEAYVWPYFAEKNLDTLSPPEAVELFRIVTAGDVTDMKEFGGYNFYRLGISPDGKWKFFVAGD